MTNPAPIAIFIYNRSEELRQMLLSLKSCVGFDESPIIVFGDGPKNPQNIEKVEAARNTARELLGSRAIYKFSMVNKGLTRSLIDGARDVVSEYGRIIVLEDDLLLAPNFLTFMNGALERYENEDHVYMVSGHSHHVPEIAQRKEAVLMPITTTQGWATWNRAWAQLDEQAAGSDKLFKNRDMRRRFNLNSTYDYATMLKRQLLGMGNSWGILWYWTVFRAKGLIVFPPQTLVYNVGMNTAGTNGYGRFRKFASSYDPSGKTFANIDYSFPSAVVDEKAFVALEKTMWRLNGGTLGSLVDFGKRLKLSFEANRKKHD
jgi:Glycosyl transferase family 2